MIWLAWKNVNKCCSIVNKGFKYSEQLVPYQELKQESTVFTALAQFSQLLTTITKRESSLHDC